MGALRLTRYSVPMDDQRDERAQHAGQWPGTGMFAGYLIVAWVGPAPLARVLGQELALSPSLMRIRLIIKDKVKATGYKSPTYAHNGRVGILQHLRQMTPQAVSVCDSHGL